MLGLISFVAIFTSIVSLIPQLYKTYKSKSADDLSLCMLINFFICSLSWIAYGVLTKSLSVWLSNLVMIIFSAILILLKIKFKKIKG
jgi:MtN3 and saliva related transmembrane protein